MSQTNVSIQGPYEAAIIAVCQLVMKIIEGQPQEVKTQMWKDYMDFVRPWNEIASKLNAQIAGSIDKLLLKP